MNLYHFLESKNYKIELKNILLNIQDGSIEIYKKLNEERHDVLGSSGKKNIQNEEVQKLDLIATDVFLRNFAQSEHISAVGCEELDDIKQFQNNSSSYIVMMDPLDGSSNVDVSVSIGSIFGIWKNSFDYLDFKS